MYMAICTAKYNIYSKHLEEPLISNKVTDGETLASLQPDGMARPVALFQLNPADLDKLDPVPGDDEYEPFLFVRQDDPLELVPSPPPPGLDDLDSVGPSSAGRRLKDRAGLGRGGDEVACLRV